ncbi:MAG: hypothetical protein ACK4I8_05550 [Armatimonadota bacterium]
MSGTGDAGRGTESMEWGDKETRRWGEAYDEVRLVYSANRQVGRSGKRQMGKSANRQMGGRTSL